MMRALNLATTSEVNSGNVRLKRIEWIRVLQDVIGQEPTSELQRPLALITKHLSRIMPQECAQASKEDFVADVVVKNSFLVNQVETLHDEQKTLCEEIQTIREFLRDSASEEDFEAMIALIQQWLERVQQHDHQENRVIQEAVNVEIGGEGG